MGVCVCDKGEPIYIVTELLPGGSLLTMLRTAHRNKQHLTVDTLIDFAAQVSLSHLYDTCSIDYLRRRRRLCFWFGLFVCLSVCPSDYSQTCERIL